MKVFNEDTITSFMLDLIEYYKITSKPQVVIFTSFEVIEFISNYQPNLLRILSESGKKFDMIRDLKTLEKYLNLPNFPLISQIIELNDYFRWNLPFLKTQEHVKKMDITLQRTIVFESYLEMDTNHQIQIHDVNKQEYEILRYFKWRSIFAYWIKVGDGETIKKIKSPNLIELLKLDFPDEIEKLKLLEIQK